VEASPQVAMEILFAEHMGFCGGVDRAIKLTEEALTKGEVWAVGKIIHNDDMMENLAGKGLKTAKTLERVPEGATVVVRSHGEGEEFFREAARRRLKLVDATCPKVKHIHELAAAAYARGEVVIVAGDPAHPEVQATCAYGGPAARVASSADEARRLVSSPSPSSPPQTTPSASPSQATPSALPSPATPIVPPLQTSLPVPSAPKFFVLSQTTLGAEAFAAIAAPFDKNARIENTVCTATSLRQKACAELAEKVDAMLVVGDEKSANTRKLFEISKRICPNTYFVQNKAKCKIFLQDLRKCGKIGVTAGASTPMAVIKEVVSLL